MKHITPLFLLFSLLNVQLVFSQDTIQQGLVAQQFLEAHNKQDFKRMKTLNGKDFSLFGRFFQRIVSKNNYKEYGELILDTIEFNFQDNPAELLISTYSKQDSTLLYIYLFLSRQHEIEGFGLYTNKIFYPTIDSSTTIDDIANAFMEHQNNTGLCIGIYDKGQKTSYHYGEIKIGSGKKPNDLTRFQMGSISKVFTGLMLADMMVTHNIDPLRPASEFLPNGKPSMAYKKKPVRLLDLTTHTAGYPHDPTNLEETIIDDWDSFSNYDVENLMQFFKDYELERKPGKRWGYSNSAVGLLGYITSNYHQQSYERVLQDKICKPLNMPNSTTVEPEEENVFQPYYLGEEVSNLHLTEALVGAGGIYTTTEDMLRFTEANLQPQNTPLSEVLTVAQQRWVKARNINFDMGIGWWIFDHPFDKKAKLIGHGGHTGGTNTMLFFDPSRQLGIFVATNSEIEVEDLALNIIKLYIRNEN